MGDFVKIGVKTALIAIITSAILLLFANVQVPAFNVQLVVDAIGKGKAIVNYYAGVFSPVVAAAFWLLGFYYLALPTFKIAMIATKWIMKVNE